MDQFPNAVGCAWHLGLLRRVVRRMVRDLPNTATKREKWPFSRARLRDQPPRCPFELWVLRAGAAALPAACLGVSRSQLPSRQVWHSSWWPRGRNGGNSGFVTATFGFPQQCSGSRSFLFPRLVGSIIKSICFPQENPLKEKMFCFIEDAFISFYCTLC